MYKVAFLSGNNQTIYSALQQTIEEINNNNGEIVQIVQSQSSGGSGWTVVTITIIYKRK